MLYHKENFGPKFQGLSYEPFGFPDFLNRFHFILLLTVSLFGRDRVRYYLVGIHTCRSGVILRHGSDHNETCSCHYGHFCVDLSCREMTVFPVVALAPLKWWHAFHNLGNNFARSTLLMW